MKNSTLCRPNISKERAIALDELIPDRSNQYDCSPGVYIRSDKDRELDILWQGYRVNNREERTKAFYLIIGFLTGVVCSLLFTLLFNMGAPSKENIADLNLWKSNSGESGIDVNVAPSAMPEEAIIPKNAEYTVKSGDTLGGIAYKFYGTVHPSKIKKLMTVNNLKSESSLQIDQKLVIPLED